MLQKTIKKYVSLFINNVLPPARLLYERNKVEPTGQVHELISHIEKSVDRATEKKSKLTNPILEIPGMSNEQNRHFLNNICSIADIHYLEVGTWKGSTLISALYGNQQNVKSAIAVDNWKEFDGPEKEFQNNIQSFLLHYPLQFFSLDCFKVDLSIFKNPVNLYYYDGHHSIEAHKKAFTYYNKIFSDTFIAIIDDWNWNSVRMGTFKAFKELGYSIFYERAYTSSLWWNGLYVGVIKKKV